LELSRKARKCGVLVVYYWCALHKAKDGIAIAPRAVMNATSIVTLPCYCVTILLHYRLWCRLIYQFVSAVTLTTCNNLTFSVMS